MLRFSISPTSAVKLLHLSTEYREPNVKADKTDIDFKHILCCNDSESRKEITLVLGDFSVHESPVSFKKCLSHIKTEIGYQNHYWNPCRKNFPAQ